MRIFFKRILVYFATQIIPEKLIQGLKLPFEINTLTYPYIMFGKALLAYNYFIKILITIGY